MHTNLVFIHSFIHFHLLFLQMNLRTVVMSNMSKFSNSGNYPTTFTFSTFTQPNDSSSSSSSNNNNNNNNDSEDRDKSTRSGRSPLLPSTSELLSDDEGSETESEDEKDILIEDDANNGKSAHSISSHLYISKHNAVGMNDQP